MIGVLLLAAFMVAPCLVGAFVGALQRADDIERWVGEHLAWQAQRARREARHEVFSVLMRRPECWFGRHSKSPHGARLLNEPPPREYVEVGWFDPVTAVDMDVDVASLTVAHVRFRAVPMACRVSGVEFQWWTFEPTGEFEVRRLGDGGWR